MIIEDTIPLSVGGEFVGNVIWTLVLTEKPRLAVIESRLSGDEKAVALVRAAADKAVAEQIADNVTPFPGGGGVVTEPLLNDGHFVSALLHSGFDPLPDDSSIMQRIRGTHHRLTPDFPFQVTY